MGARGEWDAQGALGGLDGKDEMDAQDALSSSDPGAADPEGDAVVHRISCAPPLGSGAAG